MSFAITVTESSKPKKQRKAFFEMPLHRVQKSIAAHLSKALRKELGKRSLPLRKGDRVKIMRGSNKKKEGKIAKIDYKRRQVFIENIARKKSSGTEKLVPFQSSKLLLVELERKDEKRLKRIHKKEARQTEKEGKKEVAKKEIVEEAKKEKRRKKRERTKKLNKNNKKKKN